MFDGCFCERKVFQGSRGVASIVPRYEGKGDHLEGANYREINLLSITDKQYWGMFIGCILN